MLKISRLAILSALALLIPAFSVAASAQDDPFSILAPQPAQEEETPPLAPPAAAFLGRDAYLADREDDGVEEVVTYWHVERTTLDGSLISETRYEAGLADRYAYTQEEDGRSIIDFTTGRILFVGEGGVLNTPISAHVHRQMNTFLSFTNNGTLDNVPGPGGATFERFWIEAALGIRAGPVMIYGDTDEDGVWLLQRRPDTPPIVRITPGQAGTAGHAQSFASWLRHNAPLHPDVLPYFSGLTAIPDAFSFVVFSPSSPDGRRETWRLEHTQSRLASLPWPDAAESAAIDQYALPNPLMTELVGLGWTAARRQHAGEEAGWPIVAQSLFDAGDKAGAYLTLLQATHHYGPCTPATPGAVCTGMNQLAIAALGDPELQGLMDTISSGLGAPAELLATLTPYLDRGDKAGAAAALLAAQAAARLEIQGRNGDADPLALFLQAAEADPNAPTTYWHAGRYAAANEDLETAWQLFDIARSLPAPMSELARREAGALDERLRGIAPSFFGPLEPELPEFSTFFTAD